MKQRFGLCILSVLVFALATPAHSQMLSLTKLLTIHGESQMDEFSNSISGIGDINGDGISDYLVGSPGYAEDIDVLDREDDPRIGRAYVFLGGTEPSTDPALTFTGTVQQQNLACAVAGLGDINADGVDDYIMGANYLYLSFVKVTGILAKAGFAHLYFGGDLNDPEPVLVQPGRGRQKDRFGSAIAGNLDVNGDGHNDFLISAPGRPEFPNADRPCEEGSEEICKWRVFVPERVFLFFGGPEFDAEPDFTFSVNDTIFVPRKQFFEPPESWYGESVSSLGDINSDGFDDFGVTELSTRNVYVYFGGPSPSLDPAFVLNEGGITDSFGSSLSAAGDINNDGHDDFVIGAEATDSNGIDAGTLYFYYGGPGVDDIPDASTHGEAPGDRFGTEVTLAGDLNNDGHADIAVSARNAAGGYDSNPTLWSGKVYVFYGGPSFDTTPDPVVSSWLDHEKFGLTLAPAGDVDNDGFDDLLIGAPLKKTDRDRAFRGALYIYGLPLMTPVFNVTMEAVAQDGNVILQWNTLADETPAGFRISRIENGQAQPLHEGLLAGTATAFTDTDIQGGRSYEYWIDVMERAGEVKTFGPAFVSVPLSTRLTVGLPHPNPMPSSGMRVEYQGRASEAGIYDLQGRLVKALQISEGNVGGTLAWQGFAQDGEVAANGIYFLRVLGEDKVITKRIIKVQD